MADNFNFTEGSGRTGAADDVGGTLYPRVKIAQGADGSATDVSSAAPLPVTLANTGANATAVKTDGSGVTQPVSGNVTAALSVLTNAGATVKTADFDTTAGTDTVTMFGLALPASGGAVAGGTTVNPIRIDPTGFSSQPITATALPLPTGAATSAKQPALGTAGTPSSDVLTVQGATSMTALKVDGSAVTQPVSGTVTANAGTNLNTSALALETGGNLASIKTDVDNLALSQGSTTSGQKGNLGLGAVTTSAPTYTSGQSSPLSLDTTGALRVNVTAGGSGGGAVTIADGADTTLGSKADAKNSATDTTAITAMSVWKQISASIQAAAASLAGTLTVATHAVTQSGTWTVQPGNTANTTAWKVDGSAVTQPISAASLPLPTGAALDATLTGGTQKTKLVDTGGTNVGTIKAASTAAVATDTALVVAVSPNNTVAATQSGTWTMQPGNTANTTAWLTTNVPTATGGPTVQRIKAAASTNATSVKASAGQIYGWGLYNNTAAAKFVKIYNKASAPTVGTDTPAFTIIVPASGGTNVEWSNGIPLGTGIAFAITGAVADSDTTATAADDIHGALLYK